MEYYANSFKKIKRHNIMTGQVLILVLKFRFKDFHVLRRALYLESFAVDN